MTPGKQPDTLRSDRTAHTVLDVITALRARDGALPIREQKVADYVKANLERISTMTTAELAAASGVSNPTVVRFCRSLGCGGFREFKLRLAQNLAVSLQYLDTDLQSGSLSAGGAVDRVLGALYTTMNVMRAQLDAEMLDRAKQTIAAANRLLATGIGGGSSMVAAEAANRFFRIGVPATAISDSYLLQMHAATLGAGDVLLLVSASGEADAVVSAAKIANSYSATTICITRTGSRLAAEAQLPITLDLPEDSDIYKPTASRYAHLSIIDALAMAVAKEKPESTTESLRRIRASLTAYHGRAGPQPLGD